MRRNDMSLGEAIELYLQSNGLKEQVLMEQVIMDWPKIMGKAIAENTEHIWFRSGVFYVRMGPSGLENRAGNGQKQDQGHAQQGARRSPY